MHGYPTHCRIMEIDGAPLLAPDEPSHVHVVRPSRRHVEPENRPLPGLEHIEDDSEAA